MEPFESSWEQVIDLLRDLRDLAAGHEDYGIHVIMADDAVNFIKVQHPEVGDY